MLAQQFEIRVLKISSTYWVRPAKANSLPAPSNGHLVQSRSSRVSYRFHLLDSDRVFPTSHSAYQLRTAESRAARQDLNNRAIVTITIIYIFHMIRVINLRYLLRSALWMVMDVVYCCTSYTGQGGRWVFLPEIPFTVDISTKRSTAQLF